MRFQFPQSVLGFSLFNSAGPTDFVVKYSAGKNVQEGKGLSFIVGPKSTVAIVPTGLRSIPFIFEEVTNDDQRVSVTGELEALFNPEKALELYDFSVDVMSGAYLKDGLEKSQSALSSMLRPQVREIIGGQDLKTALSSTIELEKSLRESIEKQTGEFAKLGFTIQTTYVSSVRPKNSQLAAAIEAPAREKMLQAADRAVSARREAAAESERTVQLYEAETQEKVAIEQAKLVEAESKNLVARAEADAEAMRKKLEPYKEMNPMVLVGMGIQSGNIGEINFTPEILAALNKAT